MARRAVVTGVAGFIGSHLARRLLDDGHQVAGVDCFTDYYDVRIKKLNLESLLSDPAFAFVGESLNRLDLAAVLDGVDVVFHQAAQAGVRASWGDQFDTYIDCNIRATQRLCEAARGRGVRIVYASSSSVYGETASLPMKESHPTRPVSPYGVTKLDAENMCLLYGRSYGVPVVCLRYFTVYGPRQRPDMAFHKFLKAAFSGGSVEIYGNGEQTRDFTFISDAVDANIAAMHYDGSERVFNIGGGSRVTVNHVLDIIGRLAPGPLDVRYRDAQNGDVTHTYADISLAREHLRYAPRVEVAEGIVQEAEWVQQLYAGLEDA